MSITRKAGLIAALLGATMLGQGFGLAQNVATDVSASAADIGDAAGESSGLLDDATLDAMTSPIALFPDTLLGQVLVATTYPLDVLKADRFLTANEGMTDKERAAAVNEQDWDDSVKDLAAGFPELIGRMAEHSDWTETMGDALIAQTDDVLFSIQRLRAQAKVNGYLEDNAAMTVQTDPETANITIAAADPNVVYVPQYTNVVYTQPAPANYYVVDNGSSSYNNGWGDALVAGSIIFGTAVIIDNIFDDNWGNGWDNGYWHGGGYGGNGNGYHGGGGNSIDWNGDINIDNGINIGNGNVGNGNHGGLGNGNNGGIGNGNRPQIGNGDVIITDKMARLDATKIDATKIDRTQLEGKVANLDKSGLGRGDGSRVGELDQDQLDRVRSANFDPSTADRDVARAKIADKAASGKGVAPLGAANGPKDRAGMAEPPTKLGTKPASDRPTGKPASAKPAAAKPAVSKPATAKPATAKPKAPKPPSVSKPAKPSKPPAKPKPAAKAPAYKPEGGSSAKAASARGKASRGGR